MEFLYALPGLVSEIGRSIGKNVTTVKYDTRWRDTTPFHRQKEESRRVRHQNPDRVPVIVENAVDLHLDKKKYLVPLHVTMSYFMHVLRERIKLRPEEAIYMTLEDGTVPSMPITVYQHYRDYKHPSGFLIIRIEREKAFG